MAIYDHNTIERKWQKRWQSEQVFQIGERATVEKKKYILDMFPYPSGAGLHVGHPEGYTATDIYSRYLRMNGCEVLHPMGWDAFGLPAENYAIKNAVHPKESTQKNIATFKRQIKSLGFGYDWSREINTSSPDYYQWTQWLFLQFYNAGLAYKKEAPVNWCDDCQTVLANEQVIDGMCERCGHEVRQKNLAQWFLNITGTDPKGKNGAYPERLIKNLDQLDWPDPIKHMQRNWIGKSIGAEIEFPVVIARESAAADDRGNLIDASDPDPSGGNIQRDDKIATARSSPRNNRTIKVFTTRPDTLYGATYIVLAPEHELVRELKDSIKNWQKVENYIRKTSGKSNLERTDLAKKKTGIELKGVRAINPANGKDIPIWIADYVVAGYGTGAIMAVPAHDQRDWEFAKMYNLEIIAVILYDRSDGSLPTPDEMTEDVKRNGAEDVEGGLMINSGEFDDLASEEAKWQIVEKVGGKKCVQYKLRDWLISRQRYWGAPIPIIYCQECGEQPVPEDDLPVTLPDDVDFRPKGESPLARSKSFQNVTCPKCKKAARRESDTMDTFVDSSWYFLRYLDPKNKDAFVSKKQSDYWMPVDMYVGGAEHAVLHLMYARFFTMVLRDLGYLKFDEPFLALKNQGLILGPDGQKMSKSRGNVINPDLIIERFGADTLRMYEMFMGPLEDAKPWDINGIVGMRRFLERVWNARESVCKHYRDRSAEKKIATALHGAVKKVGEDIEGFRFNTALSACMIFINAACKAGELSREHYETFLKILHPFAPHLTNEAYERLGNTDILERTEWPVYDERFLKSDTFNYVAQVNGKVRAQFEMSAEATERDAVKRAKQEERVKKHLQGKTVLKTIFVRGKLVNFVAR